MTDKKLSILVAVAVVLVAITAVLYNGGSAPKTKFVQGSVLIQGLDPQSISKIVLKDKDGTATLVRGDDGFTIAEKSGYPASVKKINGLIITCLDAKGAEKVTDNPENFEALGVTGDSDEAAVVTFYGEDGNQLVGLIKGKYAEAESGNYVRLEGRNTVYRTAENLWFNTKPADYVDKELLAVDKGEIEEVDVKIGDESYAIARNDGKKAELQNIPEGKRAKGTEYQRVFEALASLRMTDVFPGDKKDLTWDAAYVCKMENGLTYTVKLAEKDSKHYAWLTAEAPELKEVKISRTESEDELKKKEASILAVEKAQKFSQLHSNWVYEIPSYKAEMLRKPFADLIEDIPVDNAPSEVAASHILIAYEGAQRAQSDRTKEEAQKFAEEVLQKAKADDADFASLAEEYSDGPSAANGGDLGTFTKGKMDPAFEKAAFNLKVGEISDIVETPFGFHIIKRTK